MEQFPEHGDRLRSGETSMSDRHVTEQLTDEEARAKLARKTRRGFLAGGVAAVGAIGFYEWVTRAEAEDEVPWPQRRMLELNGSLGRKYLSDRHLMPTFSAAEIGGVKPNGNIGMAGPVTAEHWQFKLEAEGLRPPMTLSVADVKALPRTDLTTRFCCIEGWSGVAHWGGVRFRDFTHHLLGKDAKLPRYVYMATADGEYYVGLDIESAMHPQTLLAYEQDGRPLEERHGAPLRLAIPVKYGIKNIKRIGLIRYTDKKPADYWADEGYDWFAGL
jgi:DMSO/TMAO reductase YedYZ molybdopterin-dependent catalytic subunit